jgi:hypothetical protein
VAIRRSLVISQVKISIESQRAALAGSLSCALSTPTLFAKGIREEPFTIASNAKNDVS